MNRAVIKALGSVRAAASIELDSGGGDEGLESHYEALRRGIKYIDDLRAWFESKFGEVVDDG